MVILAETLMFLPKVVYFGRNRTVLAETRLFRPNIRFRPNFGFCEWPVSVFGVSAKNLFRSNTITKNFWPRVSSGRSANFAIDIRTSYRGGH